MAKDLQEFTAWATPLLSNLLPLPEDELRQVISYAATSPDLSSPSAVATHFKDLLGESSESLSFIQQFNIRRFPAAGNSSSNSRPPRTKQSQDDTDVPPRSNRKGQKKKEPLNRLPVVRRPNEGFASSSEDLSKAYRKKDELEDYMSLSAPKKSPTPASTSNPASKGPSRSTTPNPPSTASAAPTHSNGQASKQLKQAGMMTSDLLTSKKKQKPATVAIPSGPSMRPPSDTLSEISSALRTLEINSNPTHPTNSTTEASLARRRCNCMGKKHDVLLAAPNCMNCGKIICIKEGLAPCTFCGSDLIPAEDMEAMRRILRDEAGKEKMAVNNAKGRKVESSKPIVMPYASKVNPSAGTVTPPTASSAALSSALSHRDKLLNYQNTSAQRTRIIDQAADWETPDLGTNIWATPQERALQLKEQQKKMKELEWDGKEEWEKRRVVVAIDLKGKKVIKEMRAIERPKFDDPAAEEPEEENYTTTSGADLGQNNTGSSGVYSKNPLLAKGLIKPTWRPHADGEDGIEEVRRNGGGGEAEAGEWSKILRSGWRRVQDDMTDNEMYILDGGKLGGPSEVEKSAEPSCG